MTTAAQHPEQLVDQLIPARKGRWLLPSVIGLAIVALIGLVTIPNLGLVTPRLTIAAQSLKTEPGGVAWRFEIINNGYDTVKVSKVGLVANGLTVDSVTPIGISANGVLASEPKTTGMQTAIIPPHSDYTFEASISNINCSRITADDVKIPVSAKTKFAPETNRSYASPDSIADANADVADTASEGLVTGHRSWVLDVTRTYCQTNAQSY